MLIAAVVAVAIRDRQEQGNPLPVSVATSADAAPARSEPRPIANIGQVGFHSFHDHLAPYGRWMNHKRWGAVWRPNAGRGFRPYRDGGHWEDSGEYGTVWVSDYRWGDVPFHYGRWVYDQTDGWIWVPGYVWGPGWVIWRAGAGNIGWLPMPPWLNYDGDGDFPDDWSGGYGYADNGFSEDAFDTLWSFVDADDLYASSVGYYVIGPGYYSRFIDRTVGWTRFSIYNGHLFNRSIDPGRFRAAFGHDMRPGRRHDIEGRLGPVVDYATGRQIQDRERSAVHPLPAMRTGAHAQYGAGARLTEPTYRSHSVNVYRGSSSDAVSAQPTTSEDRRSHSAAVQRAMVMHHTMAVHPHPALPAYHPAPSKRPAAQKSHAGVPPHEAASGGMPH